MLGKQAVIDLDDAQLDAEERRRRKSQSLTQRVRRALAKHPGLRQRLLDMSPRRLLLAGVRQVSPAAAAVLERGYESLWPAPLEASDTAPPLFLPNAALRNLYASKTHIRIDKARRKLGYSPAFDLDAGMARTAEWARWANLLTS